MFLIDVCLGHLFYVYWWATYSKGFKFVFTINLRKLFKAFHTILSIANISFMETINPALFTNVGKTHLLFNILCIFKYILIPLTKDTSFPITFFQSYLPFSRYGFSIYFSAQLPHYTFIFFFLLFSFSLNYLTLLAYYCVINYFKILRFFGRMQIIRSSVLIH